VGYGLPGGQTCPDQGLVPKEDAAMRSFVIGVVLTLVLLCLGAFFFASRGYMNTAADAQPGMLETYFATRALDASIARHALKSSNPVPETDANLIGGMIAYSMNCSGCHGSLDRKENKLGSAFYPPAPDLATDALGDEQWHTFFVIKRGIRYTGMPAWGKLLDDETIWKTTSFLSRLDNLPPVVKQQMPAAVPK
jgi:mono/diheme cytochrome c family protein